MDYNELVGIYEKLESTTKNLEKTYWISKLFKESPKSEIEMVALLAQGLVFPKTEESKIGIASQLVIKAISKATGVSEKTIKDEWRKLGDLGLVAEKLIEKKKQTTLLAPKKLTVKKVYDNLQQLIEITGSGSVEGKLNLIAELLSGAKPEEAKYIIKTVLEELRLGIGEATMRDAIVWAYFPHPKGVFFKCEKCGASMPKIDKCLECGTELETKSKEDEREKYNHYSEAVQHAYDVLNDFAEVAKIAMEKGEQGLLKTEIAIGMPLKVMLAMKEATMHDAIERVGKPFAEEYKLDGFRIQCHKKGNKVYLFTRRLENVTEQFPEVVEYVQKNVKAESCLLDTEAAGFDPKTLKYRPFQEISQRIKRKYGIDKMQKELPVELNVFDILYLDGKSTLKLPFVERRKILDKIVHQIPRKIVLVKQLVTDNEKDAEKFYKESLAAGNEGVMFKNLNSSYTPGVRVGHMIKFKPVLESLDLVIIGAEWGTGKRSGWLSSFDLACQEDGEFLEIGKVGTGFKEKSEGGLSFEDMTKMLKPLILEQHGRVVKIKPKIIIEVKYEEIQKSPTYTSGFALRFPRVVQLREDRSADDCSELSFVEQIYNTQRARGKK